MTDLYDFILNAVFAAFLRGGPDLLAPLKDVPGDITLAAEGLTFTLPALFDLARHLHEAAGLGALPGARADYLRFRADLYRNQTNTRLRALGGRVVLAAGHEDHDQSLYRLERLETEA